MPLLLGAGALGWGWLLVRHHNGARAPYLIGLVAVLLLAGGAVEVRHRSMQHRYTEATRDLLNRPDARVVCERLSNALFNVWNRAGYVAWTEDGSLPTRADLTWDTCHDLRTWERTGKTADHPDQIVAVHTLTHEAMHLAGHYDEAIAECQAMQHDRQMATLLGATPADADQLARIYYRTVYPHLRDGYVSADCRPGGPLDLTPRDGVWP